MKTSEMLMGLAVLVALVGCQSQGPQIKLEIRDSPSCRVTIPVDRTSTGAQEKTVTPTTDLNVSGVP